MRKLAVISLLLSLLILIVEPLHAQQTRPRQTGQSTGQQAARPAPTPTRSQDEPQEVDEGDVIRVNTTLITVPVSVTDRGGRYIPHLRQQDFRIYEDGVEQQIAYFAPVTKPFTVALLLDTSASVHFKLKDIQDAAIAFLDQLRPDDQVMIITFNSQVEVLAEATKDRDALRDAIRRTSLRPRTLLYSAVDFVLNQRFNNIEGRKAIVLFTDGYATDDLPNRRNQGQPRLYSKTVSDAEESGVPVYLIHYEVNWPITNEWRAEVKRVAYNYIQEITQKTGGRLYRGDTLESVADAYTAITHELGYQYSLGYYPTNTAQTGRRRRIKVTVNRPDLVVQARDSYTSTKVVSRQ